MKKKLYGLILDSDGTVMDSKINQFEWFKYCVTKLYKKPFKYKSCSEKFLKAYNEAHHSKGLDGIYELFRIDSKKDVDFLWKHFNAWKEENPPQIIKSMQDTIFEIYERSRPKPNKIKGLRILLNTSNRWSSFENQFYESGLIKCFDAIITEKDIETIARENDTSLFLKPNTYSIEWALDILGVDPEEALHIGDTLEDIIACRDLKSKPNLGKEVKVVSVTWGFETKKSLASAKPYRLIYKPQQLIKIVENLGGFK